jgi:hypothetical protein
MKHLICSIAILIALSPFAFAQKLTNAEPEFVGQVLLVVGGDTPAQQLEKQKVSTATKADIGPAIIGVRSGKGMNVVKGAASPVRTSKRTNLRLIVKVGDNSKDPTDIVNLFKMQQDKGKDQRVLIVGKVVFNKSSSMDIQMLHFKASKYGTGSYLLELPEMELGEYAVTLEGSRGVFNLFGVD